MLKPEKYFDELYEYLELWTSGYVAGYCKDVDDKTFKTIQNNLIEVISERFEVINVLRARVNLSPLSIDESYDYYLNNLPKYNEEENSIDFRKYQKTTERYLLNLKNICENTADVKTYLILMGAPRIFVENSDPIQKRVDVANKLFIEGGYNKMKPQEIENLLVRMLVVGNDY